MLGNFDYVAIIQDDDMKLCTKYTKERGGGGGTGAGGGCGGDAGGGCGGGNGSRGDK